MPIIRQQIIVILFFGTTSISHSQAPIRKILNPSTEEIDSDAQRQYGIHIYNDSLGFMPILDGFEVYVKDKKYHTQYFFLDDFNYLQHNYENFGPGSVGERISIYNIYGSNFSGLEKSLLELNEPSLVSEYVGNKTYRFISNSYFGKDYIVRVNRHAYLDSTEVTAYLFDKSKEEIVNEKLEFLLDIGVLNSIDSMLSSNNFWIIEPMDISKRAMVTRLDGRNYIFEAHTEKAYKLLTRWSPDLIEEGDYFMNLIEYYLLEELGIKEKLILKKNDYFTEDELR